MDNIYLEQTVKGTTKFRFIIIRNLFIAMAILFFIFSAFLFYFLLIALLMVFMAFWFHNANKIEYDYMLLNREFEIARVTNRSRRKTIFQSNLNDLELLTRDKAVIAKELANRKIKTLDYIDCSHLERVYLLFQKEGSTILVITQLNADMTKALNPQRTYFG